MTPVYYVPTADPLTALECQARASGQQDCAEAITLARRVLPPALAQLVADEFSFRSGARWLGLPPRLLAVVEELAAMEAQQ